MSERGAHNWDQAVVIGAGIVGLATAAELQVRRAGRRVVVLEKEDSVAAHQTGRNSGVIHSGCYYKPGSMKATTCRRGIALLEAFCDEHGVEWEKCGKVIVAVDEGERGRLEMILERGKANGVDCELIDAAGVKEIEPHVAAVAGIRVGDTGIVDYRGMCGALRRLIESRGGEVVFGAKVSEIRREGTDGLVVVDSAGRDWSCGLLVNCAGLYVDRIAKMTGIAPESGKRPSIVPFRGEYFELRPEARSLVNHLIYPVPDPSFPFLGVHFTRMVDADEHGHHVECGPNAVLAFAREGYTKTTVNPGELAEVLASGSFWKLAARHWKTGLGEMHRSWSKAAFTRALQRLLPAITADDLVPAQAGVRAQALGPGGKLLDDFAIEQNGPIVNVINAPSPAATASLAIAERICDLIHGESEAEGRCATALAS